jgi:hypothetical protein
MVMSVSVTTVLCLLLGLSLVQLWRLGPTKRQLSLWQTKSEWLKWRIDGFYLHEETGHDLRIDPRDMYRSGTFFIEFRTRNVDELTYYMEGFINATDTEQFVVVTTWSDPFPISAQDQLLPLNPECIGLFDLWNDFLETRCVPWSNEEKDYRLVRIGDVS